MSIIHITQTSDIHSMRDNRHQTDSNKIRWNMEQVVDFHRNKKLTWRRTSSNGWFFLAQQSHSGHKAEDIYPRLVLMTSNLLVTTTPRLPIETTIKEINDIWTWKWLQFNEVKEFVKDQINSIWSIILLSCLGKFWLNVSTDPGCGEWILFYDKWIMIFGCEAFFAKQFCILGEIWET